MNVDVKRNCLGMKNRIDALSTANRILTERVTHLEELIKVQIDLIKKEKLVPFKCPVCDGKGIRWG